MKHQWLTKLNVQALGEHFRPVIMVNQLDRGVLERMMDGEAHSLQTQFSLQHMHLSLICCFCRRWVSASGQ